MADDNKPDDPEESGTGNGDADWPSKEPEPAEGAADEREASTKPAEADKSDSDPGDEPDADAGVEAKADEPDAGEPEEPKAEEGEPEEEAAASGKEQAEAGAADDEKEPGPGGSGGPPGSEPPARKPAAWGRPLARLDASWTLFEARLCALVLLAEIVSLSLWVCLKGMASPPDSGNTAGVVFRALAGALVLGSLGYLVPKKYGLTARRIGGSTGFIAGILLAKTWARVGVDYSANMLNWYQQASALTLLGGLGLRDLGKRLTLWLALLGGSLATAAGKHITIDLITRFLKPKARLPVVVVGWLGSSLICFSAAWGFFDHIAIEGFSAPAEATASAKVSAVGKGLGEDWFILRKQVDLDVKTFPHVAKGQSYSDWLTGREWNAWVDSHGFAERYGQDKVKDLKLPADAKRSPIVVVPEVGEPRGELVSAANLVVPFGLFVIAIRFILLSLLAISGHMSIEPEAEGAEIRRDPPQDAEPAEGETL